jgi:hypothetical protein
MTEHRTRPTWLAQGMRLCAVLMGALGIYMLAGEGLSWWRIALGLLLLVCPFWVVWAAWRMGSQPLELPGDKDSCCKEKKSEP